MAQIQLLFGPTQLHNYTKMFKIGFDRMAATMGQELVQDVRTGQMMISREQITTPMPPSVKAEAVSDPTASNLKHPISARATDVR